MSQNFFESMHRQGLVGEESMGKVRQFYSQPRLRIHNELRLLLYLGVLLVSGGTGILIYKNIDTIGHLAIIGLVGLASLGCFGYSFKHAPPFQWQKTESPSVLFDYLLLLGCLLLLIFFGYLQYQYQVFGTRWGLASFIPMCLLFLAAYYFDHQGVLSMAITNMAAWLGITVNRATAYGITELNDNRTILTATLMGISLIVVAHVLATRKYKPHFSPTYHQFGTHISYIALLAGLFHFDRIYLLWMLGLLALGAYHYFKAFREGSFYYLVVTVLYLYIGVSYVVSAKILGSLSNDVGLIYANLFYYLGSAALLSGLLIKLNKKMKQHDRLSSQ
ncbi:DUF2157 domain-containing protein [Flavihumibacter rivuli]|uniref:DUF2157 domain-containing protein n=1 Tax=Flavihumibacter rivuli TaxID=2838156 RepID=UPI001BDEF07E|nr:DUF2157 domain-containing protein [Flavihumibacter rivuli]ULQ56203.1 DUF2157 domain-containing protein [Flavihumibacter rivuli]